MNTINPQEHQVHINIYNAFHKSKTMQLAYQTTVNDLMQGEIAWVNQRDPSDGIPLHATATIIKQATNVWHLFIRKLTLQLLLYGYAIYRLMPMKGLPYKTPPDERFFPEVADGTKVIIRFNKEKNTWEPQSMPHSNLKGTKGWKLLILEPPDTTITYTPNSAGARSLTEFIRGEMLMENLLSRDGFNSKPACFTQITKQLTPSSAQGRPWFNSVNSAMLPGPQPVQDFNTLVSDRAETIERLDELSERARLNTHRQYAKTAMQLRVGTEGEEPKDTMEHREFFVSDGREGTPMTFLRGLENFSIEYDRMQNNILFSWSVPPQVLGKNINSERLASSNRLTEMAITQYTQHIKTIRRHVQEAIETLSIIISGEESKFIKIIPCMSEHTLGKLEPVLKPEVCKTMYSCVYDLPESYFDQKSIQQRQETINESSAKKERVEETSKVPSTRPKKTEAQKEEVSKAKAQVTNP